MLGEIQPNTPYLGPWTCTALNALKVVRMLLDANLYTYMYSNVIGTASGCHPFVLWVGFHLVPMLTSHASFLHACRGGGRYFYGGTAT